MAKKNKTNKTPVSKPRSARIGIIAAVVVVVLVSAIFIYTSMHSDSAGRPAGTAASQPPPASDGRAPKAAYDVITSYPHDPSSFTQGLVWNGTGFYESTGMYGQSKLRSLEFPSGKVLKETRLAPELFGEGLAQVENRLIQLTWKSHKGFVYNADTFHVAREFSYDTEGWGLTSDGKNLILSDGSSDLYYLDPQTFAVVKKLAVRMNGRPIPELNELEFIEGEIWANVWQTDLILRIDPSTGTVASFLNLTGILPPAEQPGADGVLNGIAYDSEKKRIFVTGKLWPRIFEIKLKS